MKPTRKEIVKTLAELARAARRDAHRLDQTPEAFIPGCARFAHRRAQCLDAARRIILTQGKKK